MSHCQQEGKDRIIFVTKEDHDEPVQTESVKELVKNEDEEEEGLLLPNGEINWSCPCLGGMASGPCGVEFRDAFSCFHFSDADPKGSNCIDKFRTMQECMVQYPDLYPVGEDKEKAMMEDAEEGNLEEDGDRIDHLGKSTGEGDASADSGKGTDDPIPSTTHAPSQNVNKETSSVKTSTESKETVSSEKETKS